jgi:cytochrome c5
MTQTETPPFRPRSLARAALAVLLALGGAACYPRGAAAPPPPSPALIAAASARWPGTTAASLASGHDLFLSHCNNCHDYPDLLAIQDERWPAILDKMARKAHLNPGERDEVLHFVLASRAELVGR